MFSTLSLCIVSLDLQGAPRNRVSCPSNSESKAALTSAENLDSHHVLGDKGDVAAKLDTRLSKHNYHAAMRVGISAARTGVIGMLPSMLGISVILINTGAHNHIVACNSMHPLELDMRMMTVYCFYILAFVYRFFVTWCSSVLLMDNALIHDDGPCSTRRIQRHMLQSQVLQRIWDALSYGDRKMP